jgi:hypothetical protein
MIKITIDEIDSEITITQADVDAEQRDADFNGWMQDQELTHIFTDHKSGQSLYEDAGGNLWTWDQMTKAFENSLSR